MEHTRLQRLTAAPALLIGLGLLAGCGGEHRGVESLGTAVSAAVTGSLVDQAQHWSVKYQGTALNHTQAHEYTLSAIGPQSSPSACTRGAYFLTHGEPQQYAQSSLSCLDTGSCPSSIQTPNPDPVQWISDRCPPYTNPGKECVRCPPGVNPGSTCTIPYASNCFTSAYDVNHTTPGWLVDDTDAEGVRIGPHSFLHYATGKHFFFYDANDGAGCKGNYNGDYKDFVNFLVRSDDCGATWAMSGSYGVYQPFQWHDSNVPGWNFDLAHLYVDPFWPSPSGYNAYVQGGVAGTFKGVIESTDMGATWTQRGYVGDWPGDTWGNNDGWGASGGMTSTADGTQFIATCLGTTVRLYYSYDRWLSYNYYDLTWDGGSANCSNLGSDKWPAGAQQGIDGPWSTVISRIARNNVYSIYARVRVAYPTVYGTGAAARQHYRVVEVGVPASGQAGFSPYEWQTLELGDSDISILEAGFVEMDPFDTPRGGVANQDLPDIGLLWTMEGSHGNNTLQARYRVVQGANTYSAPRDLSATTWRYTTAGGAKTIGDYNRAGAYYYDKNTKRYNFMLVWPQGEAAAPTLSTRVEPHYNVVSIQPSINSTTLNIEKLNFGTVSSDPAVASQGPQMLDIFWKGPNGTLLQKSYSNGWVANTQDRGVPAPGVGFIRGPSATSWGMGRLDVFVRGTDEKLWQWWRDGSAGYYWYPLDNGPIKSAPAVTDAGYGILYVFARQADNAIRYRKWTNAQGWIPGWLNLPSLPGGVTGTPVAVNDGTNVHVFVRGSPDANLWQAYTTDGGNTWNGWYNLGSNIETNPAVAVWGPGRFDLFARPYGIPEISLFHRGYESGWQQDWQDLLTYRGAAYDWVGNPSAVSMAPQRVDVFAQSADNVLWHVWHTSPP
jgi:hypothetical protein